MSVVHKLPGRFRIIFPCGSVLRNCQKRAYSPDGRCAWYVFSGRQFSQREIERWGATAEEEID